MTPRVRDVAVLLLTGELDFATDRICARLGADGVPFLRLNRETLADAELTLDPVDSSLLCRKDGGTWRVAEGLRSVWWRQGTFDRTPSPADASIEEQMGRSQWSAFMRSLMVLDGAVWMNDPAAVYRAETKAVQLRAAARLGFDVPATLMTNDREADVAPRMGPRIALKSVDTLLLGRGDERFFGYTALVDWRDVATADLKAAPVTVQAAIDDKVDLRVTVVGQACWCVGIRRSGGGIPGDWRLTAKAELEIEDHALPPETEARCVGLVRALGLRFGAIDLAFRAGRHWFLEINPTGEWGWLDGPSRAISTSIAGRLATAP